MSTHATLSPSRRHQWRRCPGSIREEAKHPEKFSASAADGTHTHSLIERCVIQNLDDPLRWIGVEIIDHEGKFTVDAPRAHRAKVMIEYIRKRIGEFSQVTVIPETRVNPAPLVGRNDMAGTVDVRLVGTDIITGERVVELIDYKDGMMSVEAEGNDQLQQYAVGTVAEDPLVSSVRMTIVQPKLEFKGGTVIKSVVMPITDLLAIVPTMIAEAAATDDPNAPLVPGEKQCQFCRAKGACGPYSQWTLKEAGMSFPVIQESATTDLLQQSADRDPTQMSNEQIVQIIEAAPMLRQMIESVMNEAKTRLESGKTIPGLKLIAGRGSRKWSLSEEEMAQKLKTMGVPKDVMFETSFVSPAKAEKLTWKNRKDEVKQLSERQIKTLKTEFITTLAGKPTVALDSDPAPAIVIDASPMFSAVAAESPAPVEAVPSWLS